MRTFPKTCNVFLSSDVIEILISETLFLLYIPNVFSVLYKGKISSIYCTNDSM